MPPKSPGTSYTGKPVRRLKLPKIGRTRTKSLGEECLPLPPGMKPMIGPQWPMRPGSRAVWPKLPKEQPTTAAPSPTPAVQLNQTSETNAEKKRRFVYERPTLPDRAPKLPNNWGNPDDKKAKNKKPKR